MNINASEQFRPISRPISRPVERQNKETRIKAQDSETALQLSRTQDSDRAQLSKEASELTTAPAQQIPDFGQSLGTPKPFTQGEP